MQVEVANFLGGKKDTPQKPRHLPTGAGSEASALHIEDAFSDCPPLRQTAVGGPEIPEL